MIHLEQLDQCFKPSGVKIMEFATQKSYKEYKFNIGDSDFVFFSTSNMIAESLGCISPIHTHDYCELFYVLRGRVKIHTETEILEFSEGDCAFIPENLLHTSEICTDSQRIVISFFLKKGRKSAEAEYYDTYRDIFENGILMFKEFIGADAFKRLAGYYYSDFTDRDELIIACLREIILLIKASATSKDTATHAKKLFGDTSYRNYIIDNYFGTDFSGKSLSDLANQLHLSCQQTQRIIKKSYGQTFRERMIYVKMRYAKNLLLTTDLTVTQIASSVGYTSTHSFFDTFKKCFGITPNEYRMSKYLQIKNTRI